MQFSEVQTLLNAEVLNGEDLLDNHVVSAFASDLMSDVLALVSEQNVLLTGLCNTQVLRTAEMLDMNCVIVVRGKEPGEEIIALAKEKNICLMKTQKTMFISCGILYSNGLSGGQK